MEATIEGAKNVLPVAVLLAAAGLIVGTFTLTGLGLKISSIIMSVSGGSRIIAILLALVASLVIGLSLPITATYIMTVVMVAPALVKVGIPAHVAHLLAFYFAVLVGGLAARRPLSFSRCGGDRGESLPGHDARMEVFFAGLSGALLLLGNPGGAQSTDPGRNTVGVLLSPSSPACRHCFFFPWALSVSFAGPFTGSSALLLIVSAAVMAVCPRQFVPSRTCAVGLRNSHCVSQRGRVYSQAGIGKSAGKGLHRAC